MKDYCRKYGTLDYGLCPMINIISSSRGLRAAALTMSGGGASPKYVGGKPTSFKASCSAFAGRFSTDSELTPQTVKALQINAERCKGAVQISIVRFLLRTLSGDGATHDDGLHLPA